MIFFLLWENVIHNIAFKWLDLFLLRIIYIIRHDIIINLSQIIIDIFARWFPVSKAAPDNCYSFTSVAMDTWQAL